MMHHFSTMVSSSRRRPLTNFRAGFLLCAISILSFPALGVSLRRASLRGAEGNERDAPFLNDAVPNPEPEEAQQPANISRLGTVLRGCFDRVRGCRGCPKRCCRRSVPPGGEQGETAPASQDVEAGGVAPSSHQGEEEDACLWCLESLSPPSGESGEPVVSLKGPCKCKPRYHASCLTEYLETRVGDRESARCAHCREDIKPAAVSGGDTSVRYKLFTHPASSSADQPEPQTVEVDLACEFCYDKQDDAGNKAVVPRGCHCTDLRRGLPTAIHLSCFEKYRGPGGRCPSQSCRLGPMVVEPEPVGPEQFSWLSFAGLDRAILGKQKESSRTIYLDRDSGNELRVYDAYNRSRPALPEDLPATFCANLRTYCARLRTLRSLVLFAMWFALSVPAYYSWEDGINRHDSPVSVLLRCLVESCPVSILLGRLVWPTDDGTNVIVVSVVSCALHLVVGWGLQQLFLAEF